MTSFLFTDPPTTPWHAAPFRNSILYCESNQRTPHFASGGRDFNRTSSRFGTRTLRFGSPPLMFRTVHFDPKIEIFRLKYKKPDRLTEAFRIFCLKRVLRKWGGVLRNPACPVLNCKLAVRNWVMAVKSWNGMPFWRLIRVKRYLFAVKTRIVSVLNCSIEVRNHLFGAGIEKWRLYLGTDIKYGTFSVC